MALNGTIKIIRDDDGGIIVDKKTGAELEFKQPYHRQLFLSAGDRVRYEPYTAPGAKGPIAVYVQRVTVGVISEISDEVSGLITEKGGQNVIPFFQPLLKDLQLAVGDSVRYDLIPGKDGAMAINVREIDN